MNESERNAEFPVHVDLGREMNDSPVAPEAESKKGEKRKYYPTLYISDAPKELADLPDEGCVLIKYKRRRLSVGTDGDGKKDVSLDLEVQGICLPEDMKESASEDDGDGGMDSIVDDLAKKAGVIGKKEKGSDMPSVSAHDEDDEDDGY